MGDAACGVAGTSCAGWGARAAIGAACAGKMEVGPTEAGAASSGGAGASSSGVGVGSTSGSASAGTTEVGPAASGGTGCWKIGALESGAGGSKTGVGTTTGGVPVDRTNGAEGTEIGAAGEETVCAVKRLNQIPPRKLATASTTAATTNRPREPIPKTWAPSGRPARPPVGQPSGSDAPTFDQVAAAKDKRARERTSGTILFRCEEEDSNLHSFRNRNLNLKRRVAPLCNVMKSLHCGWHHDERLA
jgi:hypothetical protein